MNIIIGFVCLLTIKILSTYACPYILVNKTSLKQTNYTNFTLAIYTACNTSFDLLICDGSSLNSTDVTPFRLNCNFNVYGITDENNTGAYLNTSAATGAFSTTQPIFLLYGNAMVSFNNLQILFSNLLFGVTQNAVLSMQNVSTQFGQVAITLAPSTTNSIPFFGVAVVFQFTQIAIQFSPASSQNSLVCYYCQFLGNKKAGIAMTSGIGVGSNGGLTQIDTFYPAFLDTNIPYGLLGQASYGGPYTINAIPIPEIYALDHHLVVGISYNCPQVTPTQSKSPTPIYEGFAPNSNNGNGGGGNNDTCGTTCIISIVMFVVLLLVGIALYIQYVGKSKLDKSPNLYKSKNTNTNTKPNV